MFIYRVRTKFNFKISSTNFFSLWQKFIIAQVILKLLKKCLVMVGDVIDPKASSKVKEAATWRISLEKVFLKTKPKN